MADATAHPRRLHLPRDEDDLATTLTASRRLRQLLPSFLAEFTAAADADGLVVALDGGVDSAVAAALAAEAVGPDRVTALVLPARISDEAAAREAEAVASVLGLPCRRLQIQPLLSAFQEVIGATGQPTDDLVAVGNALDRLRATCAYYVANAADALVVGTVNRTRRLLGPVTKYGDTAVDCFLFGDLYRTEVDALARYLDVPETVCERSPRSYGVDGETRAERLGASPRTVDRVLRLSVDEGRDAAAVGDELDVDRRLVERVATWCAATRHKRHQPRKPSTFL